MSNRLNSDLSRRLRSLLDATSTNVASLRQLLASGLESRLTAAVAEARASVPPHRAVSDEELSRSVRIGVRQAWLDELQQLYKANKEQTRQTRELLDQSARAARVLGVPTAPAGATLAEETAFHTKLLAIQNLFPHDTPLNELWDAYIAADAVNGDRVRAAWLEFAIARQLDRPVQTGPDVTTATRQKRERDRMRQQLEERRERRLTENDRGNLAAWEREIAALDAALSSVHQALIIHARAA